MSVVTPYRCFFKGVGDLFLPDPVPDTVSCKRALRVPVAL